EIKNAMAYLRLLQTRHNDAALERIINLPARGIGEKTLETLRDFARAHELSLWGAIHQAIGVKALTGRAAGALNGFVELIDELALRVEGLTPPAMTQQGIERSGRLAYPRAEKGERGQTRVENREGRVSAPRAFEYEELAEGETHLSPFLDPA